MTAIHEIPLNEVSSVAGMLALMFSLVWPAQREACAGFFALGYALTADGHPSALSVTFACSRSWC